MSIKISRQCVSTSTCKTLNRRAESDILRLQLPKGALSQNETAKNNRFVFFVLNGKQRLSRKEFNCCIKQYSSSFSSCSVRTESKVKPIFCLQYTIERTIIGVTKSIKISRLKDLICFRQCFTSLHLNFT